MDSKTRTGIFALVLALLLTLAGCGAASPGQDSPGAPSEGSSSPAPAAPDTPSPSETPASETPAASEAPVPSEPPAADDEAIRVSTAEEFLNAVAPGAVIELAPGTYNLTEYLREAPDSISDYVVRLFADGWQAEIRDVDGLTIRGAEGGKVEILAEPRYADVLSFTDCSDIEIGNVTFGHTPEPGHCEGAVLQFDHCGGVGLSGLDLYGCGTYGVTADHTFGLTLKDCVIRDCTYGIIDLSFCSDAVLEGCTLKDNSGFDMLSVNGSCVLFDGCSFTGNTGDSFLPSYYYRGSESGVRFESCSFDRWESQCLNEELKGCGNYVIGNDCAFKVEPGRRIVHASSMEQLIENIAPDTQIMLAPGKYNLSDTLSELLAREGEDFNDSRKFVRIEEVYDGPELVVTGVSGLTIASESGSAADTEIVTDPRYADVLCFENCSGTGITGLTLGHTETGDCSGSVLCFVGCGDTVLHGLDLYGCGVYGITANECGLLSCFDSTVRDCEYGALEFYGARGRHMLLNCVMTGSGGGGSYYADDESGGEFYFCRCTFGDRESSGLFYLASGGVIAAEDCSWSDAADYTEYYYEDYESDYEPTALDTSCLRVVSFDEQVLTSDEYYICYETVDNLSGDVSFESDDVRFLTFEEDGSGCFWTDDEKGRPFKYAMDSAYSCSLSFDDGANASFGLYADKGGAAPFGEEGDVWLALYLDGETLWFY